ncbi:hypothetical protein Mpal_2046 [Methanosphaerula palustris E1-9c]|uniref:Uncharacterized protein n=1 Tax=Methanosphaerula palustris (strain ATCC BAA-1556 / DSM 19958 / E1-9c) TaxID=521011 RepID=B8GDJ4_METPE|nr:hypothetical protein Mpal_2046 [Methanosphaerula palustris E1-9c]
MVDVDVVRDGCVERGDPPWFEVDDGIGSVSVLAELAGMESQGCRLGCL